MEEEKKGLFLTLFQFFLFFLILNQSAHAHVVCCFRGRLGNQLFQAAAAVALAEENNCGVYFPDFEKFDSPTEDFGLRQLKENYAYIFHKIPHLKEEAIPSYLYTEPDFTYRPIPYQAHTEISGYFISERHFRKHRDLIVDLFSPSDEIMKILQERFIDIIQHPQSVGIHVRTGYLEYALNDFDNNFYLTFLPPDMEYFKKAIDLFDKESLFVVFSDHIEWCKEQFSQLNKNFIFVENQEYIYDFYLLSKCKHTILANSTFSWWAAYLNQNPDKKVIYRQPFWSIDPDNLIDISCPGWTALPMKDHPQIPHFKGVL